MKVGDYIRTKDGVILKLNNIIYQDDNYIQYQLGGRLEDKDFLKSSPNIIDLIEVGDYVNGYLVKDIDYAFDDVVMNNKNARIVPYIDCNKDKYIDDIKSIVTKEQFESMEYRIKEK